MIFFLKKNLSKFLFVVSTFSLFVSFYFNEDGSGGGARGDFEVTYGFILALQDNILSDPKNWTLVHTPLHFIILSFVTRIITDTDCLRLIFCIFSISLPLLFYSTILLQNTNNFLKNNFLIISSIIFFIPSFRYTSIWANNLITSLIFFILSIYFFKKWELNKKNSLDTNSLFQILFLVLATYTRQYFAVFFIYFLFKYFQYFSTKSFVKLFLICIVSSLPVFFYTYLFPELLTGQLITYKAVNLFLLGNTSIMSITLVPIIILNLIFQQIKINKLLIPSIISLVLVIILSFNFNPINWQGGGLNYMISKKIFGNNIFVYFTSFLTLTILIYISLENKENIVILLILILMFFSMQVYQRYYEPMLFLIFFTLVKTDLTKIFYQNKIASLYLISYFILYYLISISDIIYKI